MWFLTVSGLRWSSAAICFVERPCSRRRSTSTWRGVRCGGGAVLLSSGRSSISPKTPTTRSPFMSGTELSSTATRVPVVESKKPVASVARDVPSQLLGDQLVCSPGFLGRYDGGVVATANVAEKPLCCRIDPPDNAPSRRGHSSGRRRSPRPSPHRRRLRGHWPPRKCGRSARSCQPPPTNRPNRVLPGEARTGHPCSHDSQAARNPPQAN